MCAERRRGREGGASGSQRPPPLPLPTRWLVTWPLRGLWQAKAVLLSVCLPRGGVVSGKERALCQILSQNKCVHQIERAASTASPNRAPERLPPRIQPSVSASARAPMRPSFHASQANGWAGSGCLLRCQAVWCGSRSLTLVARRASSIQNFPW